MDVQLTKDAEYLLCVLYHKYLSLINSGVPKKRARFFSGSKDIQRDLIPEWSFEDTDDACWELDKYDMVSAFPADGYAYTVELTSTGIVYMENRFQRNASKVLECIGQIKNLLSL